MTDAIYWIWLQNVIGIGENTFDILSEFHDPKAVYEADVLTLKNSGLFKRAQLERKANTLLSIGEKALNDCEKYGFKIVTPDSPFYPPLLRETADFPLVLYVWGDEKLLTSKMPIGVIGTRRPSGYGLDVAHTLTKELSKNGALVVSGGAQGIDFMAHTTAMDEGAKTVLIMGCGFMCDYLMENEEMRSRVTKNGALVSEFPPFTKATRVSFLQRNRITAGMCRGVLVIEAGEKSGTLSTARRSFLYNRDVFVVTGDAKGTSFLGAHELVRYGAKVIFSAQDILSLYGYEIKNRDSFYFGSLGKGIFEGINDFSENKEKKKPQKAERKQKIIENTEPKEAQLSFETFDVSSLSENERAVLEAIKGGTDRLDDIAQKLRIQIRDVLIALTNLEMEGLIECGAGNEYILL